MTENALPPDPETSYRGALKAALTRLNRRDYACLELADKLAARFPEDAVERVIAKLTEQGYLNDRQLAEQLIEDGTHRRHHGPRRIRHDLHKRKIPHTAYDDALVPYGEQETVRATARAATVDFFKGKPPCGDIATCRRLAGFLGRRGFPEGTIHAMVQRVREGHLDDSDNPL